MFIVESISKVINCSSFADNKKSQASVSGKSSFFLIFFLSFFFFLFPLPSFLNRTA